MARTNKPSPKHKLVGGFRGTYHEHIATYMIFETPGGQQQLWVRYEYHNSGEEMFDRVPVPERVRRAIDEGSSAVVPLGGFMGRERGT